MTSTPAPAEDPREFASILLELSNGKTEPELSETFATLIRRVKDTGKKGSISLVIVVEPMKGSDTQIVVTDTIKTKLPEHDRAASIFYLDDSCRPSRNDPRQMSLFGDVARRKAPEPPARRAVVDIDTGEVH